MWKNANGDGNINIIFASWFNLFGLLGYEYVLASSQNADYIETLYILKGKKDCFLSKSDRGRGTIY